MERRMTITDFGKDYGFGRFSVKAKGLKYNDNNYNNIALMAMHFDEPCEDCKVSPEDCPGLDDCNISYGR
ncbi:MAG: hypothetical protein PHS33_07555 [Candidatus Omnitrophica bacterium]|nr:hypothetical protein [Candidatus Omnitrophota bacterium]